MRVLKKTTLSSLVVFLFSCVFIASYAQARKSGAIVICAETGKVHTSINADTVIPPASLTKMMTLYLTFKALRNKELTLNQKLPVSHYASIQSPTKLWLKKGTSITVRDAILGLITKSANDAAVVLSEALGKSEKLFAKAMTQQARKLGMTKTIFGNASGLPHKNQVTTARDMATLSRALYKHFPEFFELFKTPHFAYKGTVHKNHNHLLGKVEGVDGIKTGFTSASGFNLSASMIRDGRRIIAVVLGGDSRQARDKKMTHLLETTHARLTGQSTPQKNGRYASVGELIHTLSPRSTQATSTKKTQKAVYLSQKGKTKILKTTYKSLDDLFETAIDPSPPLKKEKKRRRSH